MYKKEKWQTLMIGCILAATVTVGYAATYEVLPQVLNVREGPGTQYKAVGQLVKGDAIEVISYDEQWSTVALGDTQAYVHSDYIEPVAHMSAAPTSDVIYYGMVMSDSLNFRTGADGAYDLIEALPYGTVVEIVEQNAVEGWHYVSFNGIRGYLYADYMMISDENGDFPLLANDIIDFAMNYLGYPYVYGGSTPSGGFDCGGLVKYVFNNFGYSLSMGATTQYRSIDNPISRSELRVGDIVYFSAPSTSGIAHTGIYIGDQQFIHASSPGDVVKISSMASGYYDTYYYGAARLLA